LLTQSKKDHKNKPMVEATLSVRDKKDILVDTCSFGKLWII
jgi:hypothetical protein